MIDQETAWNLIRQNAIKASLTNTIWHSIVEKAPYQLVDINEIE